MTQMTQIPELLRARIAADYQPVRPLASPLVRTTWLLPLAALALFAAPVAFEVRGDAARLGFGGTWGASALQVSVGLALAAAAMREAVPGRAWSRTAIALWLGLPLALLVLITLASWEMSPVVLRRQWWLIGVACFGGSLASGLPAVALASVLAARAYPTRPVVAGALLGLGAGLMADAGWRLFCHFSEPAHVLSAHAGAVLVSTVLGSALAAAICRARRKS
jgi:uncharacterized membrane protein YgdD (TMEM256/DUF423 family)